MASLRLHGVGTLQGGSPVVHQASPFSSTYVELTTGVYLIAVVNNQNQCVLQLVESHTTVDSFREVASSANASVSPVSDGAQGAARCSNNSPAMSGISAAADMGSLAALRQSFHVPKVFSLLDGEGVVTAIELVRDGARLSDSGAKLLDALYVHLFIGTSNGTVLVCNALRGSIMALVRFRKPVGATHATLKRLTSVAPSSPETRGCGEPIVRFAVHMYLPDSRLNANIVQNVSNVASEALYAVHVVHSSGKVVVLDREALNMIVDEAARCCDAPRPHLGTSWRQPSGSSVFPAAGCASGFVKHITCVFTMDEPKHYSPAELEARMREGVPQERQIRDAAFFLGRKRGTTVLLRSGPEATESLILCGSSPAIATYTYESTPTGLTTTETVKVVFSALRGVFKRALWRPSGTSTDISEEECESTRPEEIKSATQQAKDVFLEADTTVTCVQVDPTCQWAACYSESGGRIYVYDLMGNAVVHVMKGCRSAEFQWHVATIAGKHMLLLVVHLVLRRVVEMHSLRLKRRIAACHVPCDAVLLRPGIASSGRTVLLSSANGTIHRLEVTFNGEVLHQKHAVTVADKAADPSGASHVSDNDEAGKLFTFRRVGERGNRASPYDALMEVIRLPLPTPADDETTFEEYCARFSAVRQNIRTMFSPGALSNNAFPTPVVATGVDVPICSTAAQCLAFIELRQTCISNYHRALHLRWDGNSPMCSVRTAETTCNDEPVFLAGGQPHQTLPPIFDRMAKKLSDDRDVVLSAIIADLLPSIGRFIQSCHSSAPANGPIDCQITAVPLNIFLEFFSIDGFRLEFQPTLVQRYEEKCDVLRDLWSELGTVFLGGGRGVVCLQQQLEICSSLGFRTMHIVAMTVSWLCRSFVQTRTWVSLGSLSDIVFLLKLTDDEAFLAAMELMPCLVVSPMWSVECCEAHLLLLAFFVVLRNNTKPFSSSHRGRFLRLLRQLLGLRASISRVESLLVKEKKSLLSFIRVGGRLRLGSLFPCNDSDTLCASFFKFYSHNAACHLASNTPWGEEVKEMLAPVDLIYWLSIIFRMNGDCGHSGEVAWYRDGQWDYEGFVSRVVEPLLSEFETIGQRCIAETANSSHLTSKRLVPLSALMVVALIMLEDTLAPLRDTTLAFWEEGSVPDSNLFEAGRGHTSRVLGRPSGSRSTRDYFKSCSALARVCLELAEQLMDNGDQQSCGKTVESIIHFLSVDEASVFPLVPIVVRLGFDDLVASLRTCPLESLERIREAYHFVQTVSLFAFRDGAVGVNMMPPSLPHISWATMYMKPDSLLTFCCSRNSRKEEFRICDSEERLMMRSVFMRDLAFALLTNGLSVVDVDFMGKLSNSMGLSRNVTDLHLLVLLHVESALLQPETEIGGLLHDITNRHLAAFIAVFNLKLILASCFRYYADLKAAIPSDRRHEKQQTVLRLQSMSATMSDNFRTWLHSNATDCSNVLVPDACEAGAGTALAFDYRLVAHLCAHGPDHVRRVEERVRECFQSSESTAKLQNMRAVALTLARIAKEGASLLPAESLCGVANELPAVVARLADLI